MSFVKKAVVVSSLFLLPVATGFAEQKAIYDKPDGANVGARVTFSYKDDSLFHVNTKPGFVTDIQLRQGEELTYVAGGDTKSFLIDKAVVGDVQHVYIKPLMPDKHTNIIINTDVHTYRFDVTSSMDGYDPLITFFFSGDRKVSSEGSTGWNGLRPKSLATIRPLEGYRPLNRNYEIKAKKLERFGELVPKEIMDDGERTYIRVPDTNKYDMPVLYMVNPWDKKRTLINYRVLNGYFVADVVMEKGVLMFHQKYSVEFINKAKGTNYGSSMRQRVAEIRAEGGFAPEKESVPAIASSTSWNPVEEEVYTVPKEAEPVKKVVAKKEKPVKKVEAERPVAVRRERSFRPQVVEPKAEPRQVVRKVEPQRVQAPPPQYIAEPVPQPVVQPAPQRQNVRYPGAGFIAEYVARNAGLGY